MAVYRFGKLTVSTRFGWTHTVKASLNYTVGPHLTLAWTASYSLQEPDNVGSARTSLSDRFNRYLQDYAANYLESQPFSTNMTKTTAKRASFSLYLHLPTTSSASRPQYVTLSIAIGEWNSDISSRGKHPANLFATTTKPDFTAGRTFSSERSSKHCFRRII